MRPTGMISTIVLLSIIGSGCGLMSPPGTPTAGASATMEATPPAGGYPAPYPVVTASGVPYPASQSELGSGQAQGGLIYPSMNDGDSIDWALVPGLVYAGYVSKVVQTHDLKVYLTLKDGRTFLSTEPAIDDILTLVEACGEACKGIRLATE